MPYFCRFVRTSYSLVDKVSRDPAPKAAHHYFFGNKVILDRRKLTQVCWKNGIHCKGLITRWVTIWEITPICIPWRVVAYNASHLQYMVIVCGEGFNLPTKGFLPGYSPIGRFSCGVLPDRDNLWRFLRTKVNWGWEVSWHGNNKWYSTNSYFWSQ